MAHVLIIEDDSMIAAIERDFLEANGFEVSVAMTGKEGLKIFDGGAIEAVLLDIGLPDTDGFLLCRKLRDISNVPILFMTARGSDDDKIKGLGLRCWRSCRQRFQSHPERMKSPEKPITNPSETVRGTFPGCR